MVNAEEEIAALNRSQAVIYFTPDGIITHANENFLGAIGYTLKEIKGQHHSMFCDDEYTQSSAYNQFWRNLAAGKFQSGEFRRFAKGGRGIWIEASYNPILDANGKVTAVVKYATDITDRKTIAADNEGKIDAINKSQAVIEFTLDGDILHANQNFLNATGYALNEIKGRHHRTFMDPSEANTHDYAVFWQELAQGKFKSAVYRRIAKGGREIWIQASYNPIFDCLGQPYKVVKYASDVTAAMQAVQIATASVTDLASVAAAIEEMTASIRDISKNMHLSKDASAIIMTDSAGSSKAATQLDEKMKKMRGIVELINNIADQVNLLAINATIEAARAGDLGKGFAVVAAEVKNLATQTTKATADISRQIQEVQSSAHTVFKSITSIADSAANVDQYIAGVACAIEEQTAVTQGIAANVQKISTSMQQISGDGAAANKAPVRKKLSVARRA